MKKRILCLIGFVLICFASFAQTASNSFKIDLSNFVTWDKNRDIFNSATGELTLKEGWGGDVWFWYSGNYNYVEIKYKNSSFQFIVEVEYSDKTSTKIMCKKNANVAYIKLEPKKVNDIIIQKKNIDDFSVVIESIALVQKKSVNGTNIEQIVDKKEGNFNSSVTAIDLVKQMKVGWNLATALEADPLFGWEESPTAPLDYVRSLGNETELCWGNPYTTKELINFPKSQGYSSIRIPVTWYTHIIDDKYTIDPEWMARVKEIVDWSIEAGYYVILNSHHDVDSNTVSPLRKTSGYIVKNDETDIAESKRFLKAVWTQIATAFNGSYDEHLIFEVMNEPRNNQHEHEWQPGVKLVWMDSSKCEECIADYKILNEYNQLCLDTIRASGGNNANRFVMIPSMCAEQETALSNYFELPKDTAQNKLILSVHDYALGSVPELAEKTFSSQIKQNLASSYSQLNKKFIKKGIPVVVGETASLREFISKQERIKWISYLSKLTSNYGIPIMYWDAPTAVGSNYYFDQIDRRNLRFIESDFVQAMLDNWKCE